MNTISNCPLCKGTSFEKHLICKDYSVSKEDFTVVKCSSCGFTFTNPIPEENQLGRYYESEDYISHSNTSKGIVNKLYQIVRNFTLKKKVKLLGTLSNGKNLLDIGCGTGEYLNQAQQSGYQTKGIEPSSVAREQAIKNFRLSVSEEGEIKRIEDKSFDFITMWHVLEHVYHLNDRIKELKRILKNDGYLIIAVPNHESYDAKHYKEYWAAYDVPIHLYHFTPNTIKKLFENHGLSLHKTLPMKFDSFYVSMLSEKYMNGKVNLVKAFLIGLISNLKGKKDETYSSQIYIFKKTEL